MALAVRSKVVVACGWGKSLLLDCGVDVDFFLLARTTMKSLSLSSLDMVMGSFRRVL